MPNSIPERAWSHILADFITKLPLAQGYNSILVVVDWFTKMAHFVPTTKKTTAEGLARLFRDNCGICMDYLKASFQTGVLNLQQN